jgi:hypothetical protein
VFENRSSCPSTGRPFTERSGLSDNLSDKLGLLTDYYSRLVEAFSLGCFAGNLDGGSVASES